MRYLLFLFVAFTVTRLLIGDFFDERPVCMDGWGSPSIGRQGACSHHGGVQPQPATAFFISVAVAIGALVAVRYREIREAFTPEPTRAPFSGWWDRGRASSQQTSAPTEHKQQAHTDAEVADIIAANRAREQATREYLRKERERRNKRNNTMDEDDPSA